MGTKAYSYIRFSTPEQLKGSSLERQLEASRQYARDHGLDLDESMQDLGLSGFHGIHRTRGALGEFLKLIDAGKISKGSYLIVENLDRLSRQDVLTALNLFTSIIDAGITIVTLQDGMEYSKTGITDNWAQLIISITYMARAHDESLRKSQRGKSTWSIKRDKAQTGERKLTARCPSWLQLSEDKKTFIPISEACNAIERIFLLKSIGYGNGKIVRTLNQSDDIWKPPYNKKRKASGWRESYIAKILTNRAVIGEYTPCHKVDKKRVPLTELVNSNYYPPIISEDLFYKVQERRTENKAGRTGKFNNLFRNVILCGFCGKPMHYVDKGSSPKGGIYLHCDASRRKVNEINCNAKAVRYDEFEKLFFENFETEIKDIISKLLPDDDQIGIRINEIDDLIRTNSAKISQLQTEIYNTANWMSKIDISKGRTLETYHRLNVEKEKEINKMQKEVEEFVKEKESLKKQKTNINEKIDQITEIYSLLNSIDNEDELISLRIKINHEIRKMFDWIKIYPLQIPYKELTEIEDQPGIVQVMNSRYIDKIRFRFKGISKSGVILERSYIDIGDETLKSLRTGIPPKRYKIIKDE